MKQFCYACFVILNVLFAHAVQAACCCQPNYSWTGFYAGVHGGYEWSSVNTSFEPLPSAAAFGLLAPTRLQSHPKGGFGGIQVGYNYQVSKIVVGLQADVSAGNIRDRKTQSPIILNSGAPFQNGGFLRTGQRVNWLTTARLRVGYAFNQSLVYASGGLAVAQTRYTADTHYPSVQFPVVSNQTSAGWAVGAGLEYALSSRWSVGADYQYYDVGKTTVRGNPTPPFPPFQISYEFEDKGHVFKVGANYRI